jgi:hypothetical protein
MDRQDYAAMNLSASRAVAVREFHGTGSQRRGLPPLP